MKRRSKWTYHQLIYFCIFHRNVYINNGRKNEGFFFYVGSYIMTENELFDKLPFHRVPIYFLENKDIEVYPFFKLYFGNVFFFFHR